MRTGFIAAMVIGIVAVLCLRAEAADGWKTDFQKAAKEAKESGKYMLLDFSGSDWCGWCIRLDQEVFSKKEFKEYAEENLVRVLLDFPRRKPQGKELKQQNRALMKKYGVRGFPTIIVLSPTGQLVGRTGYRAGGPEKYVEHLKGIIEAHKAKVKEAEKKADEAAGEVEATKKQR
jgi:thioredoxin-related protein